MAWTRRISRSRMLSIRDVPRSVIALRRDVTFASGGTPVGSSQSRLLTSVIECCRATGPPSPRSGSNTVPSIRPNRVTKLPASAPGPPFSWHWAQDRPLNSGPSFCWTVSSCEKRNSPCATAPVAPAASFISEDETAPLPKAAICRTTPCARGVVAVSHSVRPSSETASPASRSWGKAAWTRRTARTFPPWVIRTTVLLPRLSTYRSDPPPSVVLLAKFRAATSTEVGAMSTGRSSQGVVR